MIRSESQFEHVVFIIGAGHSISANAPSTAVLTSWIIDGSDRIDRSQWSREEIDLLKRVEAHLATSGYEPTYESIFTWLWTSYFSSDPTMYRSAWDSADPFQKIGLVRSVCNEKAAYDTLRRIEEGVWQAVRDERLKLSKAPALTLETADDPTVGHLTLLTLNHDRVLERRLSKAGHVFCDGFEPSARGPASWSASGPETRQWEKRIQLIKMHGSIDWWSRQGWNDGGLVYRNPTRLDECDKLPLLLVGTGPKLFQSSNLMFARQIIDAGRALSSATCVIVVGYGFGDVRMNSLWSGATERSLDDHGGHPLPTLIIDCDPKKEICDRVRATKRPQGLLGLLGNTANELAGRKIVASIENEAAKVQWDECKAKIEKLAP